MKEQLIHILDQSVCLSRKQMKEYLSGTMLPEETHAAEVHLSSCPLCSLAMEGFSEHSEQALEAIAALNSGFLKDHFDNISPQIHLNSMAPAASLQMSKSGRKRANTQPLWRVGSIAAAMLLLFGLVWAFERSHNRESDMVLPTTVGNGAGTGNGGPGNDVNDNTAGQNNAGTVTSGSAATASSSSPNPSSPASQTQIVTQTHTNSGAAIAKNTAAATNTLTGSPADRQNGSLASAKPVSGGVSVPQSDPGANIAAKDPPATKTFIEYDPNSAEQTDKPAATSTTVAARSTTASSTPDLKPKAPATSQAKPDDTRDDAARADESYSKGSWGTALNGYKKGMNSPDERTRYHSMVMAAQCYAALGNKAKAEELLQRVIDNGPGPDRRAAKRALRKLK